MSPLTLHFSIFMNCLLSTLIEFIKLINYIVNFFAPNLYFFSHMFKVNENISTTNN